MFYIHTPNPYSFIQYYARYLVKSVFIDGPYERTHKLSATKYNTPSTNKPGIENNLVNSI